MVRSSRGNSVSPRYVMSYMLVAQQRGKMRAWQISVKLSMTSPSPSPCRKVGNFPVSTSLCHILLSVRSGLFHCLSDLVSFAVYQIWSISLFARSGLFHCLPDVVNFTVCQIWPISLSARSGLFHCPSDLAYFTVLTFDWLGLGPDTEIDHI